MNLDDLNSTEYSTIEQEESPIKFSSALLGQNIIGHDYLHNSEEKIGYDIEDYSQDDANLILNSYTLGLNDENEILSEAKSLQHITDMAEDKKRRQQQQQVIQSHGALGIASSIGVSVLDIPSWIMGMGYGKIAGIGANAYKLGVTGSRLSQAGAGLATATSSYYALEKSLDGDVSNEALMINGALGFGLGYAFSGVNARTPDSLNNVNKVISGEKPIEMTNKESTMFGFMRSPSDLLKGSDNPATREVGNKLTRSMQGVNKVMGDTVNDYLRIGNSYLTDLKVGYDDFRTKFKDTNGRAFDETDEVIVNKIGHDIDHKFTTAKDDALNNMVETERSKQIGILDTEVSSQIKQLEAEYKSSEIELTSSKFEPIEIPKKEYVFDRINQKRVESKESIDARKLAREYNKKQKAESDKIFKKEIKDKNKELESKIQELNNTKTLRREEIKNSKFDDESMTKFEIKAREIGDARLKSLLDGVDPRYKDIVNHVRTFKQQYGNDISKYDVDGLGNIDTNFHWSRQYDASKISANPKGAEDAFTEAFKDNFTKMTKTLEDELRKQARIIVNNIINKKSIMETIDLDKALARNIPKTDSKGKTNAIGRNLKDRTLRLNGSKLTDYMNNDIISSATGYSHSVGGRIGLKKVLGIDKNHSANKFAHENGMTGKDIENFEQAIQQANGTFAIDPRANALSSKMVRMFNSLNYINFGGWFGANTLSDLAGIVNDFQFSRTAKYVTNDLTAALKKEGPVGKKLARYLGYAAESVTNDRAIMFGANDFNPSQVGRIEKTLATGGAWTSKLSGMNMVIDMMDRVASVSSLDYILTASNGKKFVKTMNRLGLSQADVKRLRNTNGLVEWKNGAIDNFNFDALDEAMKTKLERGLRRAVSDVILKGNALDAPAMLTTVMGSHAVANALFQFLRFPAIAYNKLGRKMMYNFDAIDATTATATSAAILTLTAQLKDIGREDGRFDLDKEDGQIETAKFVIERMPHFAMLGITQNYVDVLGRALHGAAGSDYKKYNSDVNLGITLDRINDIAGAGGRMLDGGDMNSKDLMTLKSFMSTNMFWLQPFNNMVNDEIKK